MQRVLGFTSRILLKIARAISNHTSGLKEIEVPTPIIPRLFGEESRPKKRRSDLRQRFAVAVAAARLRVDLLHLVLYAKLQFFKFGFLDEVFGV